MSPYIQYAKGIANGRYPKHKLFLGMVQAMVQVQERQAEGKGLQNLHYAPQYSEFLSILQSESSQAYKFFRQYFPASTIRQLQYVLHHLFAIHPADLLIELREQKVHVSR